MKNNTPPCFDDIVSLQNLYEAWGEFVRGKKHKKDVMEFALHLAHNISVLHDDLCTKKYQHGAYVAFSINDPKPRNIHKATVRDRLLHHAIHRMLYPFFDRTFIADSYSCRVNKGTLKATMRFQSFAQKVSQNNTRTCWILKCDIRKFFASIDHAVMLTVLVQRVPDHDTMWLLECVIKSFESTGHGKGLPLGNLTSQLLVNIYMNAFDQFVKHELGQKYYIRYADDFVFMSNDRYELIEPLPNIEKFLSSRLHLALHPNKVSISTLASGVDFLGWVHFPDHRVLRTATKRRMIKNIKMKAGRQETVQSYLGMMKHGNARKLMQKINSMGPRY